jgi:hypothetical protein
MTFGPPPNDYHRPWIYADARVEDELSSVRAQDPSWTQLLEGSPWG